MPRIEGDLECRRDTILSQVTTGILWDEAPGIRFDLAEIGDSGKTLKKNEEQNRKVLLLRSDVWAPATRSSNVEAVPTET